MNNELSIVDMNSSFVHKSSYFEYYSLQASSIENYLRDYSTNGVYTVENNQTFFLIIKNADRVFAHFYDHFKWDWDTPIANYLRNLLLVLLGSVLASLALSVFIQVQMSRCYNYLNQVYGMMCTFNGMTVLSHKIIMIELFANIENKVSNIDSR